MSLTSASISKTLDSPSAVSSAESTPQVSPITPPSFEQTIVNSAVQESISTMIDSVIADIERIELHTPQLMTEADYDTLMSLTPTPKHGLIKEIWVQNIRQAASHINHDDELISSEEIMEICTFIDENRATYVEDAIDTHQNIYLRPDDTGLARAIQFTQKGGTFLHFNRTRLGDPMLGVGGYKTVKFAVDVDKGCLCASAANLSTGNLKTRTAQLASSQNEIAILKLLRGIPGCVQCYEDVEYEKGKIVKQRTLLELCNGGNLQQAIATQSLSEDEQQIVFRELTEALAKIHEKGIVHHDIKPDNLLLHREEGEPLAVKFTDFGSSGRLDVGDQSWKTKLTTIPYTSPECIKGAEASYTSDVWSLGCVLGSMLGMQDQLSFILPAEEDPYGGVAMERIEALAEDWLEEPEDHTSLQHLVWEMLQVDPSKRITAQDAAEKLCGSLRSKEQYCQSQARSTP